MEYRIIIKTEKSGTKIYYVQKRKLWYFWAYIREYRGRDKQKYATRYYDLESAKDEIQNQVNKDYEKRQKKIVKKEVLWNP